MYKKMIAIVLAAVSLTACGSNTKTTDTTKLPVSNETTKSQKIEETDATSNEKIIETVEADTDDNIVMQRYKAEEKQKDSMPEKMPDTLELVIDGQKIDFNKNASQFATLKHNKVDTLFWNDDGSEHNIDGEPIDLNTFHFETANQYGSNGHIDYVSDGFSNDKISVGLSNYTDTNTTLDQGTIYKIEVAKYVDVSSRDKNGNIILKSADDPIEVSINGIEIGTARPADVRAVFGRPAKTSTALSLDGAIVPDDVVDKMVAVNDDYLTDPNDLYYADRDDLQISHMTYVNDNYLISFELTDPAHYNEKTNYENCIVSGVKIEPRIENHKFHDEGVNAPAC